MLIRDRKVVLSLRDDLEITLEVRKVLGYLLTWGIGSERYNNLYLSSGRDDEIHAAYSAEEGGPTTFFMAAIKGSDGTYTTHS